MNLKLTSLLPIALVVLVAVGAFLLQQIMAMKNDPSELARREAEQLVAEVSKLILLPQGELPTIATVNDPSALSGQDFFAKAEKGHKVLLYPNAQKAFLYDPKAKRILEVAPINLGAPVQTEVSAEAPEEADEEETEAEDELADGEAEEQE